MGAFRYILIPLDFTPKNNQALELVRRLATPGVTRVSLMHVVEAIAHEGDEPLTAFYRGLEEKARRRLDRFAGPLEEAGVEVERRVVVGRPARKIVDEAITAGVDLIVLSSHPLGSGVHDGERWATTSYQAAIFCRCPVLLVK